LVFEILALLSKLDGIVNWFEDVALPEYLGATVGDASLQNFLLQVFVVFF
jgi:hypothetical protein